MPKNKKTTATGKIQEQVISGGIALPQEDREALVKVIMERFAQQGGTKGAIKLTPEMQESVRRLRNTGTLDNLSSQLLGSTGALGSLEDAKKTLTGAVGDRLTPEQVARSAEQLYNSDLVKQQVSELQRTQQEGLEKTLGQLEDTSIAQGSMGASRAALARGLAAGRSQEALAQGTSGILATAMDKALGRAQTLEQGQQELAQKGRLAQGASLAQIGSEELKQGLGARSEVLSNLVKAGQITQAQADALQAAGGSNLDNMLQRLSGVTGATKATEQTKFGKTEVSGGGATHGEIATGVLTNLLGAAGEAAIDKWAGSGKSKTKGLSLT